MAEFAQFAARLDLKGNRVAPCPIYDVNLDLPPLERWREVATSHRDRYADARKYLLSQILGPDVDTSTLPWFVRAFAYACFKCASTEDQEEISAFANLVGASEGEVALMNYLYELRAKCSSFVVNRSASHATDGRDPPRTGTGTTPLQGRNMDWEPWDVLCQSTVHLRLHRSGTVLYECVTWPGYLGVLTAVVPGKFSISVNFRDDDRQQAPGPLINVSAGSTVASAYEVFRRIWASCIGTYRGARSVGFLVKSVVEGANGLNFNTAAKALATTPVVAPVYFTMAGAEKHEGLILLRGPGDDLPDPRQVTPFDLNLLHSSLEVDKFAIIAHFSQYPSAIRWLGDPRWTSNNLLLYVANADLSVNCTAQEMKDFKTLEVSGVRSSGDFCLSWDRIQCAQKYATKKIKECSHGNTTLIHYDKENKMEYQDQIDNLQFDIPECIDLLTSKPICNECTVYMCVMDPSIGALVPMHCARHEIIDKNGSIKLPKRRPDAEWQNLLPNELKNTAITKSKRRAIAKAVSNEDSKPLRKRRKK